MLLKQLVDHSRPGFLGQCSYSSREYVSHILNFLGAPEVEKLRRMRKSKSRHRQPMLLKMLLLLLLLWLFVTLFMMSLVDIAT